jgi:hypothetical protein
MDLLRRWADGCQLPHAWIWAFERGCRFGLHTHILVHVPEDYYDRFRNWVHHGFTTMTEHKPRAYRDEEGNVVKILHLEIDSHCKVQEQWRHFRYIMKGIGAGVFHDPTDPHIRRPVEKVTGIKRRTQGTVSTKRLGTSRMLDEKARRYHTAEHGYELRFATAEGPQRPEDLFSDWYLQEGRHHRMLQTLRL